MKCKVIILAFILLSLNIVQNSRFMNRGEKMSVLNFLQNENQETAQENSYSDEDQQNANEPQNANENEKNQENANSNSAEENQEKRTNGITRGQLLHLGNYRSRGNGSDIR